MQTVTDHELALRARSGDDSAFTELMRRHYKGVLNFIYRFTNGNNSSEDLTQEAFLRVYKSIKNYEPEAKFSTWLYKIATNLCLTHLKKNKRDLSLDEINENIGERPDPNSEDAYDILKRRDIKDKVMAAISTLPEREKVAITLCKYQGFSYNEVAEVLDCSVGAVKTHIYRGRIKLVEKLKPQLGEI